jgi:hypothetical protein
MLVLVAKERSVLQDLCERVAIVQAFAGTTNTNPPIMAREVAHIVGTATIWSATATNTVKIRTTPISNEWISIWKRAIEESTLYDQRPR